MVMSQSVNSVKFQSTTEGIREMAVYVAQLVREGIVYEITRFNDDQFRVVTTGGY